MLPKPGPDHPPDSPRPAGGGRLWIVALVAVAALLGWLASEYGDDFDWRSDGPNLAYLLLLIVLVLSSLAFRRSRIAGALKSLAAWAAIGLALVIGYSYRGELKAVWYRVAGELDTARPTPADRHAGRQDDEEGEGGALAIRQSSDGHYYVYARINGSETRLLVDTGATHTVLTKRQAERAGLFPSSSEYALPLRTANGVIMAAPVRISSLDIGEAHLDDVPALVGGDTSVLGISALQRFKSYEVRDGVLTLRW